MNNNWANRLKIALVVGFFVPQIANAQTINPFDYAIEQAQAPSNVSSQQVLLLKGARIERNASNQKILNAYTASKQKFSTKSTALTHREKITSKDAKRLIETLTKTYGAPTSVRGHNYVWDVTNPDADSRQAKMVTIIVNYQESGMCELIMDRDKGEDGSTTWAVPRKDPKIASLGKNEKGQSQQKTVSNDTLINPN